jgi:molecular chaperone GrpE
VSPPPAEEPDRPQAPAWDPESPAGPAAPAQEPGGTPPPAGEPDRPQAPAGDPESPVSPTSGSDGAAPPAPRDDHERQLERDLEELAAKAEKADEYLELAKRTKADFENYRKRAAREAAAAQDRGIAKLARELRPALDNPDRAGAAVESPGAADEDQPNGAATLISGIKLVHADVLAALQRAGIERYSPKGEQFNPQRHEAIAQQPVEGAQPGTIVEVYQQGYVLGEAVIRPARVVVAG